MPQQQSPFLEGKYGWNFGEGGWNTGMDENLLKFSYMFDRNVDGIVSSLPAAVNGQAYFLTSDNRLYFCVETTWYSSPVPKWFEFKIRNTGEVYQFNGTAAVQIESPAGIDARLDAVELTLSTLGTAAFEDVDFFATQAELDIVAATAAGYTDSSVAPLTQFDANLQNNVDASKGANLLGFDNSLTYTEGVGLALNSLFSKASRVLFSNDYAVDPTGVVSSSVAINQMFTEAKADGKVVVIRPGTYKITTQCDYSGLSVFAHGASFNIDHSAADPTQNVTGFRAISGDSHWRGGIFDIVGTSFNSGNAANINGTRQGAFWIGEYSKAGTLTRMENISLLDMRFRCTGGFYGLNQIQLTGNISGVKIDQVHGKSDGRAGRLIAFEWGRDTVANKTYHPENIEIGTITGDGYRQKFSGAVLFLSGVTGVSGKMIRGKNVTQTVRIVAGDNGETLALPEYTGRILRAINFETISSSESQWRGLHVSGRGDTGNVTPQVSVGEVFVTGNGGTVVGGYFEGTSVSFNGGETGNYTTLGMKAIYRAFGAIQINQMRVQDFAGYGYYQGSSSDADASTNSFGTGHIGLIDAQNIGGPAFYIASPTASFEVCRIDQINAQACSLDAGFTGNLDCFGGYGVADADLTRVVEISIGSGRIGVVGSGAAFGIRSPGGAVRANYYGLKVGNGTVFTSAAVSHGAGGSNDRVTHVGCDFVATTPYGGVAPAGTLA